MYGPSAGSVPEPGAWDRFGMGLSGLCAVHCLLLPSALFLLPLWPAVGVLHAWLHPVLAAVVAPTTLLAMWEGFRRHRCTATLALLGLGLLLVLAALAAHEALGARGETLLNLAGSGLLIAGHWCNQRKRNHPENHRK